MSNKNREEMPKISVENGVLKITIGISNLANAVRYCDYLQQFEEDAYTIDEDTLAQSLTEALLLEGEDGTTLIHRMFDIAVGWVCEQGEPGIEFDDE